MIGVLSTIAPPFNREQIKSQALWAATQAVLLIQEHKVIFSLVYVKVSMPIRRPASSKQVDHAEDDTRALGGNTYFACVQEAVDILRFLYLRVQVGHVAIGTEAAVPREEEFAASEAIIRPSGILQFPRENEALSLSLCECVRECAHF